MIKPPIRKVRIRRRVEATNGTARYGEYYIDVRLTLPASDYGQADADRILPSIVADLYRLLGATPPEGER